MSSIGAQAGAATSHGDERADVELRLPADSAYASVLRTTTAGLAARLDFPIDDIEDLRIDHDPGRPVGLVELAVSAGAADELAEALEARNWTTHR